MSTQKIVRLPVKGYKQLQMAIDKPYDAIYVKKSMDNDGDIAEKADDKAGLTVNKNVILDGPLPPFRPSGCPVWYTSSYYSFEKPLNGDYCQFDCRHRMHEKTTRHWQNIKLQVKDFSQ